VTGTPAGRAKSLEDWTRLYGSQAELDAEFTLDSIPNLDEVRARRERAAAKGLVEFPPVGPLSYGSDPDEQLLLCPARSGGSGPAPAQVFFHGGFWSSMQASDFAFLAGGFVPFGAALVLVDYPLIPRVRLSDVVASCRKALRWLHPHCAELGVDADRIFISGNSAGGHLVAELLDEPSSAFVRGGCAISGLYDLAPVAASFRNELLGLTEQDVARLSPLRRPPRMDRPLIVAVGEREAGEFLRQSALYAEHARSGGAAVEHLIVPETDHITVVLDAFADPKTELNRAARRQMGLPT
jgi:arylformamidase